MSDEVITKHYRELAQDYDKYLYYSPDFVRTLTSKMLEKLELKEDDIFVDLCGGTGIYSIDLHKQLNFKQESYCVDAFQEMLDQIPRHKFKIKPVCMDAFSFSQDGYVFNKAFIKEAIHHIKEREVLFENIYNKLPAGGRLLLVHVPPKVEYPIFKAALKRAENWHACPDEMTLQLQKTGFHVEHETLEYKHRIPKEVYFAQVSTRFMSVLHTFSDEEMAEGLAEMEEEHRLRRELEFIDRFDYLTSIKP